jgi:hypothetical protein
MTDTTNNSDTVNEKVINTIDNKLHNSFEDEIDAIRIDLYEKSKGLTDQQFHDQIGRRIAPVFQQFGFKYVTEIEDQIPKKLNTTTD